MKKASLKMPLSRSTKPSSKIAALMKQRIPATAQPKRTGAMPLPKRAMPKPMKRLAPMPTTKRTLSPKKRMTSNRISLIKPKR